MGNKTDKRSCTENIRGAGGRSKERDEDAQQRETKHAELKRCWLREGEVTYLVNSDRTPKAGGATFRREAGRRARGENRAGVSLHFVGSCEDRTCHDTYECKNHRVLFE